MVLRWDEKLNRFPVFSPPPTAARTPAPTSQSNHEKPLPAPAAGASARRHPRRYRAGLEPPLISADPFHDATDFYAFRSYEEGRGDFITILANYYPLQDGYGGPNYS
jgi:Domain of unknown function (DUF4331)